ncbi:GM22198 [Drosophila sechellia]|uniref:GM22198 n=1 Tax=Drosophila sechellia TaxID=7238 RepID=B4IAD8_DROSE|nr:GM22198 [Drosophila sechellia]
MTSDIKLRHSTFEKLITMELINKKLWQLCGIVNNPQFINQRKTVDYQQLTAAEAFRPQIDDRDPQRCFLHFLKLNDDDSLISRQLTRG